MKVAVSEFEEEAIWLRKEEDLELVDRDVDMQKHASDQSRPR